MYLALMSIPEPDRTGGCLINTPAVTMRGAFSTRYYAIILQRISIESFDLDAQLDSAPRARSDERHALCTVHFTCMKLVCLCLTVYMLRSFQF